MFENAFPRIPAAGVTGLLLLLLATTLPAQESPELKRFLETRNFLDLIRNERQDQLTLSVPGRRQEREAARTYTVERGFRVQAFAGTSRLIAEDVAAEVRSLALDSVYVFLDGDALYKVQIGNFESREAAQILLEELRRAGFQNAWVVSDDIHAPKSRDELAAYEAARIERESPPQNLYYSIQVFASSDERRAAQIKASLEREIEEPVEVIRQEDTWKVVVGRFPDQAAARLLLLPMPRMILTPRGAC